MYNHVASGFTDANPYLRELTLKSMAVLGPKLSQKTLSQSLLKHLAKLQVEAAGGWRLGLECGAAAQHSIHSTCMHST